MFYNTYLENEIKVINGITHSTGINLVSNNHPFPYLVEQEERFHGALLAQTTLGGLFRLFDSFTTQAINSLSNYIHPTTYVENILAIDKALVDFPYFRQVILDLSLQVHESVAKYKAYLRQSKVLKSWPHELSQLFEEDSARYSLLLEVTNVFGIPEYRSEDEFHFKDSTLYLFGKWCLNTFELSTLWSVPNYAELRQIINDETFWDESIPMDKALFALEHISNNIITIREDWNKYGLKKIIDPIEQSIMHSLFNKRLYSSLNRLQHQSPYPQSITELATQVAILGERIRALVPRIYHNLPTEHVEMTYGEFIHGKPCWAPLNMLGAIKHDPAYHVFYMPKYSDHYWKPAGSLQEFMLAASAISQSDKVYSYISLVKDSFKISFLSISDSTSLHMTCEIDTLGELYNTLNCFNPINHVILILRPPVGGLTNCLPVVKQILEKYGRVVIWKPVATINQIFNESSYLILTQDHIISEIGNTLPLPLITIEDKILMIASVPYYITDLVYSIGKNEYFKSRVNDMVLIRSKESNHNFDLKRLADLGQINGELRAQVKLGLEIYEIVYHMGKLPMNLDQYDTLSFFYKLIGYE